LEQAGAPEVPEAGLLEHQHSGITPSSSQLSSQRDTDSSDGLQSPGQKPESPVQQSMNNLSQIMECDTSMEIQYADALAFTTVHNSRALNFQTLENADSVPQFGAAGDENTPTLNIYVRCIVSEPTDLVTRTLTNPRIVQNFKLVMPNTFGPQWYNNFQFLHIISQRTISTLENCFPCLNFTQQDINYKLEPQSIFYNYVTAGHVVYHRLNLPTLYKMEQEHRTEHLNLHTPEPLPFTTVSGITYHACYDSSVLIFNINKKQQRFQPPNHLELVLLEGINDLIARKSDAIDVIAKLLTLYHTYRDHDRRPLTGKAKNTTKIPIAPEKQQRKTKAKSTEAITKLQEVMASNAGLQVTPMGNKIQPQVQYTPEQIAYQQQQEYMNHLAQQQQQQQIMQHQQLQLQQIHYQNACQNPQIQSQSQYPLTQVPPPPPPQQLPQPAIFQPQQYYRQVYVPPHKREAQPNYTLSAEQIANQEKAINLHIQQQQQGVSPQKPPSQVIQNPTPTPPRPSLQSRPTAIKSRLNASVRPFKPRK